MLATAYRSPLPPPSGEGEGRERATGRSRSSSLAARAHDRRRSRLAPPDYLRRRLAGLQACVALSLPSPSLAALGGEEAFAAACLQDRRTDTVPVCKDVGVPEPDHPPAGALEIGCASGVIGDLLAVLPAVEFDNDAGFRAGEVE